VIPVLGESFLRGSFSADLAIVRVDSLDLLERPADRLDRAVGDRQFQTHAAVKAKLQRLVEQPVNTARAWVVLVSFTGECRLLVMVAKLAWVLARFQSNFFSRG
jgi:hypothetical protein